MLADDALVTGAQQRLIAAGLAGGRVEIDRGEPTKDDRLPLINVFVSLDDADADGDARTGAAAFVHATTMTVEVFAKANSARALKQFLSAASADVMRVLLPDLTWALVDDVPVIEGVAKVRRVFDLPPEGGHVLGRVQVQMTVLTRSLFVPVAADKLATVSVASDFDIDGTSEITIEIPVPTA